MARDSLNRIQSAPMRRRPMSPLIPLLVVLVLIALGLFLLSRSATEQPVQPIEVDVAHDATAR
ncbi:hypothetical protein [Sphingomonas sp.]|uniref:hypothetical protein n=1 Tax=Sphingomonas sp. TaxID=28214 RepID=UPI003751180B